MSNVFRSPYMEIKREYVEETKPWHNIHPSAVTKDGITSCADCGAEVHDPMILLHLLCKVPPTNNIPVRWKGYHLRPDMPAVARYGDVWVQTDLNSARVATSIGNQDRWWNGKPNDFGLMQPEYPFKGWSPRVFNVTYFEDEKKFGKAAKESFYESWTISAWTRMQAYLDKEGLVHVNDQSPPDIEITKVRGNEYKVRLTIKAVSLNVGPEEIVRNGVMDFQNSRNSLGYVDPDTQRFIPANRDA